MHRSCFGIDVLLFLPIFISRRVLCHQVSVKRSIVGKGKSHTSCENVTVTEAHSDLGIDKIRKGKLLIVDLAGSERIDKSGKLVVAVYRSC